MKPVSTSASPYSSRAGANSQRQTPPTISYILIQKLSVYRQLYEDLKQQTNRSTGYTLLCILLFHLMYLRNQSKYAI